MPYFAYQVRINNQDVSGVMEAPALAQAESILRDNGWEILRVHEKTALLAGLFAPRRSSVAMGDVLEFTSQLLTLLDAGLPIDRALKILINTLPNPNMSGILQELLADIERGSTLYDAFTKHPQAFPRLYVNMVKAGEEGGILPITLGRLIDFYERSIEFRSFLVSSSIYPLILLVFGIGALIALTVLVIPKFAEVFENMGRALPPAAAFLIGTSHFLTDYGIEIILGIATAGFAFYMYIRQPTGKLWWHQLLLRLPLLGNLLLKANLSRACRTLGTLLMAGVPILNALRIVSQLSDNLQVNEALSRLERGIRDGEGLAAPMRADRFFPPLLTNLVTVGEETGDIARMLMKVADQYDGDVRKTAKRFVALFEPIMIVVMGGLIGAIVVSMMTAIFSLNDMPK